MEIGLNKNKTENSYALIKKAIAEHDEINREDIIVYGFMPPKLFLGANAENYAVKFSRHSGGLLIIAVNTNGQAVSKPQRFNKHNIEKVSKGLRGEWRIYLKDRKKPFKLIVPRYLSEKEEKNGLLTVAQRENAALFMSFMEGLMRKQNSEP